MMTIAGLLVLVSAGSGCVYWRLARLRSQLGEFSRYFEVAADPGPTVRFRKPILEPGDIAWLLDLPPGEIRTDGAAQQRIWPLRKRGAPDDEPPELARIDCRATIAGGRIAEVSLPERFNRIIDQEVLEGSFAGSDTGTLDRGSYRTGWVLQNSLGIPDEPALRAVLGWPGELSETPSHRVLTYVYDMLRNGVVADSRPVADVTGQFTFSREHGRLVLARVRYGRFVIRVVSNDGRDYRVVLHRASGTS